MSDPFGSGPIGPTGPGPSSPGMVGDHGPRYPTPPGGSFLDLLKSSVNEVNHMQHNAGDKIRKYVTGEIGSLHEVMIASEEAGVAFNLLMQIRNQLMRAWDELHRMPV